MSEKQTATQRAADEGASALSILSDIRRGSGGWNDCDGCSVCLDEYYDESGNGMGHAWEAFERDALSAIHYGSVALAERDAAYLDALRAQLAEAQRERDTAKAAYKELMVQHGALTDWRCTVTATLQKPGGCFYEDVPKEIRNLREELTAATAARTQLAQERDHWKHAFTSERHFQLAEELTALIQKEAPHIQPCEGLRMGVEGLLANLTTLRAALEQIKRESDQRQSVWHIAKVALGAAARPRAGGAMSMRLLDEVVDLLMVAALNGDRKSVSRLLHETVRERTQVMHERAQAAEGRAAKAERRLARLSEAVGYVPDGSES